MDGFQKEEYLFKLVLAGDSGCGKSSLVSRFCDKTFKEKNQYTIGVDFKIKTITVDGKLVKLQIWDTAGQERFRTMATNYYRGAHGVLVVYDITNKMSYHNIDQWMRTIRANSNASVVIIGNKSDLADTARDVPTNEAHDMARANDMAFLETSAKNAKNVDEVFYSLARELIATNNRGVEASSPGSFRIERRMQNSTELSEGWFSGWCY